MFRQLGTKLQKFFHFAQQSGICFEPVRMLNKSIHFSVAKMFWSVKSIEQVAPYSYQELVNFWFTKPFTESEHSFSFSEVSESKTFTLNRHSREKWAYLRVCDFSKGFLLLSWISFCTHWSGRSIHWVAKSSAKSKFLPLSRLAATEFLGRSEGGKAPSRWLRDHLTTLQTFCLFISGATLFSRWTIGFIDRNEILSWLNYTRSSHIPYNFNC